MRKRQLSVKPLFMLLDVMTKTDTRTHYYTQSILPLEFNLFIFYESHEQNSRHDN